MRNVEVDNAFQNRYRLVILFFVCFSILILVQLFRWQVVYNEKYVAQAKALVETSSTLLTRRGVIYAHDMTVLSIDEPAWFVYISVGGSESDNTFFESRRSEIVDTLSTVLELDKADIEFKLSPDATASFVPIAHYIGEEQRQQLLSENLPFVFFEHESKRVYPNGKLASNVLGFIGNDNEGQLLGKYGITGFYWGDLSGMNGYRYAERDVGGNVILKGEYDPIDPRIGKDIVLTIRPEIQRKVEEGLKTGVISTGSLSGSAVVMDPKTGAVWAMASYPTYDPNSFWEVSDVGDYRNRTIADAYEFGSVNKVVTISTALELGRIDENYICIDDKGYIDLYDKRIYTWDHLPDGRQTPAEVLKNSNNVCAIDIGLKMTSEEYYNSLKEFGLIDKVGIGLEDESSGRCPSYAEWTKLDLAMASFGQMFTATPLQITSAISAVANDGKRMQPYIVEKIEGEDEVIDAEPRMASQPLSEETANKVSKMLNDIVIENSVMSRYLGDYEDYKLAGKTGTAQIPLKDAAGYKESVYNVTYVAFGPYDDAQFIMLVWLEEPSTNSLSSMTAVPVWADIFDLIKDDVMTK